MLPNSTAIKREAKRLLAGKWPSAIAAVMVFIFFFMFMAILYTLLNPFFSSGVPLMVLTVLTVFFAVALGFPLMLGVFRVYRCIFADTDTDLYTVFYYFSSVKRLTKAIGLCIFLVSKFALTALLLLLPSILIDALASGKLPFFDASGMPIWFSNLWVFGTFLRGIAVAVLVYIILRYYLCAYIFVQNDNINVLEAVLLSKKVGKLSISGFVGLGLSLIGWLLLSLLAVPIVFTVPYIIMCYTVHCNTAIDYYNRSLKSPTPFADEMEFDL